MKFTTMRAQVRDKKFVFNQSHADYINFRTRDGRKALTESITQHFNQVYGAEYKRKDLLHAWKRFLQGEGLKGSGLALEVLSAIGSRPLPINEITERNTQYNKMGRESHLPKTPKRLGAGPRRVHSSRPLRERLAPGQ